MIMSVISDCNADSVIIRVPQELAVLMVKSIAGTSDKRYYDIACKRIEVIE